MTNWVALFDVASHPFSWGSAGEGLVALGVLAVGAGFAWGRRRRSAAGFAIGVALVLAGVYVARTVRHRAEHGACADAVRRGEGRIIEGVASDVRTDEPPWGSETFVVAGTTVSSPAVADRCGFARAALRGAVREGTRVRVRMWNGQIVKLEIGR